MTTRPQLLSSKLYSHLTDTYQGFCDDRVLAGFEADGEDPRKILTKYMGFYNSCLAGKPADLHVGMHLCRGE